MFSPAISVAAERVLDNARKRGLHIATAESCTGGLIASALTDVPGSSDVFERGFVGYSNRAKTELLGVPADLIIRLGAVSAEVARAMAEGALAHSQANVAVSCTGIAGPGGGSDAKPVGLVYLALARTGFKTRELECRFGPLTREEIRMKTVEAALQLLADSIATFP